MFHHDAFDEEIRKNRIQGVRLKLDFPNSRLSFLVSYQEMEQLYLFVEPTFLATFHECSVVFYFFCPGRQSLLQQSLFTPKAWNLIQ